MQIKPVKKTKRLIIECEEYNRKFRKKEKLPGLTIDQYIKYITGRGLPEHKKPKIKPLSKVPEIPSWASSTKDIPSNNDCTHHPSKPIDNFKVVISKNYPVSIPYNKGGYQVLLKSEIQNAGKKI